MSKKVEPSRVVSREVWLVERRRLLEEERALTHERDRLRERRQQLPWVRVDKEYRFEAPDGPCQLEDLFAGRSQLLIKHFMFGPGWREGCVGCSFEADHIVPATDELDAVVSAASMMALVASSVAETTASSSSVAGTM